MSTPRAATRRLGSRLAIIAVTLLTASSAMGGASVAVPSRGDRPCASACYTYPPGTGWWERGSQGSGSTGQGARREGGDMPGIVRFSAADPPDTRPANQAEIDAWRAAFAADPAAAGPAPAVYCDPVPPTPAVADWGDAPLTDIAGELVANPATRGLTGLVSYFAVSGVPSSIAWTGVGRAGLSADCTLTATPTAEFTAAVVGYAWDLGERGSPTYSAGPAVEWMYQAKDHYELWVGAVLDSPDLADNAVVQITERPYTVIEVRAVLTG